MKSVRNSLLILVAVVTASALMGAEKKAKSGAGDATATVEHKVFDAANLSWGNPPPGLPAGAQFTVLSGDPTKKGVFTVRLRMPDGYKVPPHTHPTAELITLISGNLHLGSGDKFDESNGHSLTPGSFMAMPANAKHFAWSTGESIVQIHGEGPFAIKYVNPADDPRNAKK